MVYPRTNNAEEEPEGGGEREGSKEESARQEPLPALLNEQKRGTSFRKAMRSSVEKHEKVNTTIAFRNEDEEQKHGDAKTGLPATPIRQRP